MDTVFTKTYLITPDHISKQSLNGISDYYPYEEMFSGESMLKKALEVLR